MALPQLLRAEAEAGGAREAGAATPFDLTVQPTAAVGGQGAAVTLRSVTAKTTVWRFTPDGKDGMAHDVAGMVVMTGEHSRLRTRALHLTPIVLCFQGMTSGC